MTFKPIAAATACVLFAALGPLSAARADAPTPSYADVYTAATNLYSYDSQISGSQDWAMPFQATDSGTPNSVTVATNTATPQNIQIFSGDFLGGNGTLVATKTGTATIVTDPTQGHGNDYTYALQPASATSVLLKNTWYTLVVTVPYNTPVGLSTPYSNPNAGNVYVGQAGSFVWSFTDTANKLAGAVNVQLDTTPPSGSVTYTTEPTGTNNWYTVFPTAHFVCSDVGTGVATCPQDITATADGDFTPEGTVTDLVGLTALIVGATVHVDTTPPDLSATYQGVAGDNGWYTTQADLSAECTDATSGVASCLGATVDSDGTFTLTATAKDNAGNTASKDVDVKVDSTAPELTTTYQGVAGTNGWYTTQAALAAECTDATSGVANCTGDNVTADGTFTLHASAKDNAGNVTTKDVEVKVDSTAPIAAVSGVGQGQVLTVGNTGAITCTAEDVTSGIASCTLQATPSLSVVGRHSVVAVAVDNAGNQTTSEPVVVYTAPLITWGPANNMPLKAGSYVTFTYTLRTAAGKLIDAKVAYLQPLPRTNTHYQNFSKYAARVSTGQYKMRVYITPSMAKTKYWKFGVTVGGRTLTRIYVVK